MNAPVGMEAVVINPYTLSIGKMFGGLALIGLLLYFLGTDMVMDLLVWILLPVTLLITAGALLFGGGAEMWSHAALAAGFQEGVKRARSDTSPSEPYYQM